jgi:hypothetical protein
MGEALARCSVGKLDSIDADKAPNIEILAERRRSDWSDGRVLMQGDR